MSTASPAPSAPPPGMRIDLPVPDQTPVFRRATPADAVELALATFVEGRRVDLGALAVQLNVSRATLHRWFGSREQLLDQVLGRLASAFTQVAREEAQGDGDERVCDFARRLMEVTVEYEPARSFVAREPQLALKLLLGELGSIRRVVAEGMNSIIAETRGDRMALPAQDQIDVILHIATSLVWASFMIGDEPKIDAAVSVIRTLLAAGRVNASAR